MNDPLPYLSSNLMQKRDAANILSEYKEKFFWKDDDLVLDIGCGPGDVTSEILRPFTGKSKLVGSDISNKMVECANRKFQSQQITFKHLNVENDYIWNDWKKEEFDKIFSFYCLHWIRNHDQALSNIYNLLKPGGQILLLFLAKNPIYDLFTLLLNQDKWRTRTEACKYFHINKFHLMINASSYYETLLKNAMFKNIECKVHQLNYSFSSLDKLIDSVNAVNPIVEGLSKNEINELSKDEIKLILTKNLATVYGNSVMIEYSLISVYATK